MNYEDRVKAAAAALKSGEDANWTLAQLTYENTNRKGVPVAGRVSHARWSADVRAASGRRFSETTSNKYSMMWERYGATSSKGSRLSWTDAWVEVNPRDSGRAMRERATDTHIGKEASAERKVELLNQLLEDDEVLALLDADAAIARAARKETTLSFDERCAQWVHRANKLLMDGARLAAEADASPALRVGGHAEMALLIHARLTERHLDAEIRSLLEAAEAK